MTHHGMFLLSGVLIMDIRILPVLMIMILPTENSEANYYKHHQSYAVSFRLPRPDLCLLKGFSGPLQLNEYSYLTT